MCAKNKGKNILTCERGWKYPRLGGGEWGWGYSAWRWEKDGSVALKKKLLTFASMNRMITLRKVGVTFTLVWSLNSFVKAQS
jgi:hypothetical protein